MKGTFCFCLSILIGGILSGFTQNDQTAAAPIAADSFEELPEPKAAASFASQIQDLAHKFGDKGVLIALSGEASPRLKQELQNRGFALRDRVSPGPLK